jgi:hypothetical protein
MFGTMLEDAQTLGAIGLNQSRLSSNRAVIPERDLNGEDVWRPGC